jgi:hypothetical protein
MNDDARNQRVPEDLIKLRGLDTNQITELQQQNKEGS